MRIYDSQSTEIRSRHRYRIVLTFFLAVLGFYPLTGNASPAGISSPEEIAATIFATIGTDKSLLASEKFLLVDDFNTGKMVKRQGATWRIKQPVIGALEVGLERGDARLKKRGYSLKARYHLSQGESVSFETFLGKIDVSRAGYFVFKGKLLSSEKSSFSGRVFLTLKDWRHVKVDHEITGAFSGAKEGEWQDVILPIHLFESLDLDQLVSLTFVLSAAESSQKGNLWVDEIAFYGEKNIAFESHRDNMAGFPEKIYNTSRRERLRRMSDDRKMLKTIAYDTWQYFENAREKNTHLIADHIRLGEAPLIADYTSPTNIAMDMMSTIVAENLGFISKDAAVARMRDVFTGLARMPKFKGFFYNFYDIKKLSIGRKYISSVDSGWLAIALVVVRQAYPDEFSEEATKYLDGFDFGEFLDPENNQLVVGFDVPIRNFGQYHYGMLVTEARATSLYAIGKGDLPRDHWWFLFRTLPEVWRWQSQEPEGQYVAHEGVEYFQGYYTAQKKQVVPSWGGSLFEFLMPTLVLKERELAPEGLGKNNRVATEIHRDYARQQGYPVWGMSPCAVSSGRKWTYREYGVPALGAKGYGDHGVITPHVSFLALDSHPEAAIANIRKLLDFEAYGEYGFYDALEIRKKKVNPQYLALDQGMTLVALGNHLADGVIQELFHSDPIGKNIEELLAKERFFKQ